MKYDFDEIIDRKNTNSENVDGWRSYIFKCGPEQKFPYADDDFIRMWVADMEFAVAPEIRQAIIDRINQKILGYTIVSDHGYYDAVQKWCDDRYGWHFPKEELVFSPGVIPALYQLIEDLLQPGEKAMTFTPAYGFFLHACKYNNRELVQLPLIKDRTRYCIDFGILEKKAADPAMKLLVLCNPHNPAGRIWTEQELSHIAAIASEHGLWIISDEIHCDLIRCGLRHTPMGKIMPDYKRLITCMSASKTFNLAGMQFSHIIIRDKAERSKFIARDKTIGAVNPLSVAAHKAAYEQGGQWLEQLKAYLDGNFTYVDAFIKENFPEIAFKPPEATYFAWLDMSGLLPEAGDLPLFFANNAGVLLEGGDKMFVGNAKGHIRLNLAMPRKLLEKGLHRMKEAIAKNKRQA